MFTQILRVSFVLLVSVVGASALTEEKFSQDLDVSPGGKLVVDVAFGTIEIAPGADDKAVLQAERKLDASDAEKEKAFLEAAPMTFTKEGNVVTVRARRQSEDSWSWHGHVTMDARFVVHVPKNFNADLHTGGGEINVSGITGTVKTDTAGGKLKFTNVQGPIDGRTAGGDIQIAHGEGALKIETNGGKIDVLGGSGSLNARTSGGSVAVQYFNGDADVETNGGKLTLENIRGRLDGRTSGGSISATLPSPVAGDVKLQTSAGSIDITVPSDAGLDVNAETSVGSVRSELPFGGQTSERDELKGRLNGGGKSLVLRSGSGSITIRPASTQTAQQ